MEHKRNFPDFLSAYFSYARDQFCPDAFHFWTGISIIAGALERKVWIPYSQEAVHYPNLFVILVAHPGVGKSSATNIGTRLLREIKGVSFIPTQVTEAKFIDLMSAQTSFNIGTKNFFQSTGYFYASEASNSLKNIYGDFIACITDFYDCPSIWEKATQKDGRLTLTNVCFNMLAGSTFDYLSKLVTDDNIMGGFASRLTYVIHDEQFERNPTWEGDGEKDQEIRKKLLEDLQDIHKMAGPFRAEDAFKQAYFTWFKEHDKERANLPSEKLQALMARKGTNIFKLCMILSASESSDRILREVHWHKALELLDSVYSDLPKMLRMTQASQGVDVTQRSLIMALLNELEKAGGVLALVELINKVAILGYDMVKIQHAVKILQEGKKVLTTHFEGRNVLKLNVNVNDYL